MKEMLKPVGFLKKLYKPIQFLLRQYIFNMDTKIMITGVDELTIDYEK